MTAKEFIAYMQEMHYVNRLKRQHEKYLARQGSEARFMLTDLRDKNEPDVEPVEGGFRMVWR